MKDIWQESFNLLSDPLFIVSTDSKIVEVNLAALEATGRQKEEIIGYGICDVLHGGKLPHIECPLEQLLATFSNRVIESHLPGLSGDYLLNISKTSYVVDQQHLLVILARELSTEEAQKVEYHRAAKLAAIGELAAGVAHEINNPINGIINLAQLLLDDDPKQKDHDLLERVVYEGERIASITRKLLWFAKEEKKEKSLVTIHEVIEDCLSLFYHQLEKDGIEVVCNLAETGCKISASSNTLQQVFFNLLSNSRYALNQKYSHGSPDKKIEISSNLKRLDDNQMVVSIKFKDWGDGIPQGLIDRVYDPFFTTKPCGEGTGLGLSISHGIIKEHGGHMKIESILHKHTFITIDLPAIC